MSDNEEHATETCRKHNCCLCEEPIDQPTEKEHCEDSEAVTSNNEATPIPLRLPWKRDASTRIADDRGHLVADFLGFTGRFSDAESQRLDYAIRAANAHTALAELFEAVKLLDHAGGPLTRALGGEVERLKFSRLVRNAEDVMGADDGK